MSLQYAPYVHRDVAENSPELPSDLLQSVFEVERNLVYTGIEKKIAVFDFDNTLIVGDIGDSVFAALKLKGYLPGLGWERYRRLLNTNKAEAYCLAVTALSGLSERSIQKVTLDVLSRRTPYLELEKSFIPVPFPHPVMVLLVSYLRLIGYQIHVISASNEISVRIAAWRLFEIPPFNVHGIRQRHKNGFLTDELLDPLPIGEGKVEVYKKFVGGADPLITGGDSFLDIPMLQLTDPRGLSLWIGEDKVNFEIVRRKLSRASGIQFLQRPVPSKVDEESSDD